jgi:hypothetical protein
MDRTTAKRRRLFEHDRPQAKFSGSQCASQSGNA